MKLSGEGGIGHKVVVYSHEMFGRGEDVQPRPPKEFRTGGPVHIFHMDSSWGANGEPTRGGVDRRVWLYNESTGQWASQKDDGSLWLTNRPYGHNVANVLEHRVEGERGQQR